jgi:hypothetical protein
MIAGLAIVARWLAPAARDVSETAVRETAVNETAVSEATVNETTSCAA